MPEVKIQHFGPNDTWRSRDELVKSEQDSQRWWDALDDPKREALVFIVRESLTQMLVNPDSWVPTSMEPADDHRVDLYISIHLAEIDDEVVHRKLEAEKQLVEATQGVQAIEADLRSRS